jgi:hypothetical protein
MEQWTATAVDCLDINDMESIDTVEAGDLELEDAGTESIRTPIRLTNVAYCSELFSTQWH